MSLMDEKNGERLEYRGVAGKGLEIVFDEPELTSDAGLLVVGEYEKCHGIIKGMAGCFPDRRVSPRHTMSALFSQRVNQIMGGNPDANASDRLRDDATLKSLAGTHGPLASQPTMSRLENSVTIRDVVRMSHALGKVFLDSFEKAPDLIIIDMDPTAHLIYGQQQLGLFNTHVGDSCLMPFHVYDGVTGRLIAAVIREGKTPTAAEIIRLLKRVVKGIRKRFPKTHLMFRADSHHTKPGVLDWLVANKVGWATGLAPNARLAKLFAAPIERARKRQELYKQSDRFCQKEIHVHASAYYQAESWSRPQRVVCRILFGPNGFDVRYIVTSYPRLSAKFLYTVVYCGRGEAELFIKDHKSGLQSDRSPCQSALANQFRLLLHSIAYTILHGFREKVLAGTTLAKATFAQIRVKLIKVAGRVQRMKTCIRFHLPQSFGFQDVFRKLAATPKAGQVPVAAAPA